MLTGAACGADVAELVDGNVGVHATVPRPILRRRWTPDEAARRDDVPSTAVPAARRRELPSSNESFLELFFASGQTRTNVVTFARRFSILAEVVT